MRINDKHEDCTSIEPLAKNQTQRWTANNKTPESCFPPLVDTRPSPKPLRLSF